MTDAPNCATIPSMPQPPCKILRSYLKLSLREFERETGISRPSIIEMERGNGCGAKVWRRVRARWPLELRELGLTADDFIDGKVRL